MERLGGPDAEAARAGFRRPRDLPMPCSMEVDFRTQIEVAGYVVAGRMPTSAFGTRVAERQDSTGEAFWDASQAFLKRLQLGRAGAPEPTPFRYALLPAMFAARTKHGDDWL